ncbi:MAG: hypothetical protein U9O98_09845 [Asgard group archaeon]|nr:hypothetical protein [Asgard group archaeon]
MSTQNEKNTIQCGYCQAEIPVPRFASIVTCEYCGTPNELETGKTLKNHHMLSVYFSGSELTELIPQYLSKYVGVPNDFADKAIFREFELRMMPFWMFKFHGRTEYHGIGKYVSPSQPKGWSRHINIKKRPESGVVDLDQTCLVFGYEEKYKEIKDEKIPVAAKEAFNINAVKAEGGTIYDTEYDYNTAFGIAENEVRAKHNELMYREIVFVEGVNQDIELKEVSYLHVPFYRVNYQYGKWKGEALVDAARGKVLRAEYPISRRYRFWGGLSIFLAIALITGAIFVVLLSEFTVAGWTAAAVFLGIFIFALKETLTKKKVAAE